MKKFSFNTNTFIWMAWCFFTAILAYFIFHNAYWQVGDEHILMSRTGSGHPFSIFDTIKPEIGRFFPLAYYAYNLLWLVNDGYVSAFQHYFLVAMVFVVFSYFNFSLIRKILVDDSSSSKVLPWVALIVSFIILQRMYSNFSSLFTTIWIAYLLFMLFAYFTYLFYQNNKIVYACLALFSMTYVVFASEIPFTIALSFGAAGLIFNFKNLTARERIFNAYLVVLALFFLIIYYFVVFRYTISAYSGSHGEDVTFIGNALSMLLNQKLLFLALIVFSVRLYKVLVKNDSYEKFYDTMLLTGLSYTLGCFILKLNWGMYYTIGLLLLSFSLFYYLKKYLSIKVFYVFVMLITLFYVRNFPRNIQTIQKQRLSARAHVENIMKFKKANYQFVWIEKSPKGNFDDVLIDWKREALRVYLSYVFRIENYDLQQVVSPKTVVFSPIEYDKSPTELIKPYTIQSLGEMSGINISLVE